jgi:CBS domain-containing protein
MTKTVRESMTTNPRSIDATASVVEAAQVMRDEHVGSLPVVEDGRLAGMITDRDVAVRIVAEGADPQSVKVGDIASRRVVTAEPDQDLDEARRLMAEHQVRRLPVVEGDELVGILAQADVSREEDPGQVGEMVEAISAPSNTESRV